MTGQFQTFQGLMGQGNQTSLPSQGSISGLKTAGTASMIGGALLDAVGAFYGVQARQYELKGQALSLDYAATEAALNAQQASFEAEQILADRNREIGQLTLRYAQQEGARRARNAAAGLQAGVGSVAELGASLQYAKEADVFTIDSNATRARNAARMAAVSLRSRAAFARTSADNARRTAGSMNPWLAAGTSILGSAASMASAGAF